MKILVLSQYWYPENGVPQRRWSWLTSILVSAGHEVTVVSPPPHYQRDIDLTQWWKERRNSKGTEEGPSGERIVRSGYIPTTSSLTYRALNQAWVALSMVATIVKSVLGKSISRPDVVIGTVPALPTAIVTRMVARVFSAPFVVDLRDAWPDLLAQSSSWNRGTGKRSLRQKILTKGPLQVVSWTIKTALNSTLRTAAGLIVTSEYLRSDLLARHELRRQGRAMRVTTIRNVFPPESSYRSGGPITQERKALNVLYAGTLGRAQHLANAVTAVQHAEKMGVKVNLRLMGTGAAREGLRRYVANRGLDVSVEERQPADGLDPYYQWADSCLVHLTDWEPLTRAVPSKTYELMAAGLHISGVVAGETAELIRKLGAGHAVDPEDPRALAELWVQLANDRTALQVSDEAARWVQKERDQVAPIRLLELMAAIGGKPS